MAKQRRLTRAERAHMAKQQMAAELRRDHRERWEALEAAKAAATESVAAHGDAETARSYAAWEAWGSGPRTVLQVRPALMATLHGSDGAADVPMAALSMVPDGATCIEVPGHRDWAGCVLLRLPDGVWIEPYPNAPEARGQMALAEGLGLAFPFDGTLADCAAHVRQLASRAMWGHEASSLSPEERRTVIDTMGEVASLYQDVVYAALYCVSERCDIVECNDAPVATASRRVRRYLESNPEPDVCTVGARVSNDIEALARVAEERGLPVAHGAFFATPDGRLGWAMPVAVSSGTSQ